MKYSTSTQELKHQIADGKVDALCQLYDRYYVKLKLYGLQFAPKLNSYSIEDTIQELFLWISNNHHKLAKIKNLEVYLFSALKRNAIKEINVANRRSELLDGFFNKSDFDTKEDSAEIRYIEDEYKIYNAKYVTRLLDSLPPKQKEVLYLRNYMNMSFKEIGEVVNLSEQVVRNYNHRAIKHLRVSPLKRIRNL